MAHIAVLGLGNWGSAIARLWLLEGHKVKGWTIEQEVYESITMEKAAKSFKCTEDEIYEGVASLTKKVPTRIQIYYEEGKVHIAAE